MIFLKRMHLKIVCKKLLVTGFLCLLTLLLFSGSALSEKNDTYILPIPGTFIPALNNDQSVRYITADTIEALFQQQSKEFKVLYRDRDIKQYIIPQHAWLKDMTDSFLTLIRQAKLKGKADTWDCENYSALLNALTTVRIWEAGYFDTRGAVGWLRVDAKKEWAGLPGVMHALMFAVTENGLFIIEPQNGQFVRLEAYPNKQFIQEVFLF